MATASAAESSVGYGLVMEGGRSGLEEPGRFAPRAKANSLPTLESSATPTIMLGMYGEESPGLKGGANRDTLPSMYNGMSPTVPQNLVQHDLNNGHQPPVNRARQHRRRTISVQSREHFEMRCCRINVLLVIMQLCLGIVITALGLYMETLTGSLKIRECPYWAGVPLMVTGIVGIYFCATDFAAYAGSFRAFLIKAICLVSSSTCIFVCMVAAVFPGLHGSRISHFNHCDMRDDECECSFSEEPHVSERTFAYDTVRSCDTVITSIKDYLILQCAFNAIASGVCMWFVMLLWKSRYQDFHSGLRFYSYSASVPPHP